jgi:CRISPR-associated protein (TIGR02710 family)
MATLLVLTAGTTAEPLAKAVEELRAEDPALDVLLLYGRPFPGQDPSPFDTAQEVKTRAAALGVGVHPCEVADPEDLDACLQAARAILRQITGAHRVVVNFTGGTKVLSAAVVHAALTEVPATDIVFDYIGGAVRDRTGRVVREAMRVRRSTRTGWEELLRHVLDRMDRYAYREALALAGRLPDRGHFGFTRRALEALCKWDEFDYEGAVERLRRLHEAARSVTAIPEVEVLAATVTSLVEPGNRLTRLTQHLRALQDGSPSHQPPPPDDMGLVTADALENAERRLHEGRFTDCVLRAYRAVETSVQTRLLAHGVNPWRPDWGKLDPLSRAAYEDSLQRGPLPKDLALTTGLALVQILDGDLPDDLTGKLRDLQYARNRSYLEHGYHRITEHDAHRLVSYAAELATRILSQDIAPLRHQVAHRRKGT